MYFSKDKQVLKRQRIEARIVRQVVDDALAAGFTLDVDTGGDEPDLAGSRDRKAVLKAMMETDEDYLILHRGQQSGWVRFVYGNEGWYVINDYTVNLEPVLAGANALAERLEARAGA